jgi:ATP-dependent DNA helicase RecG
LTEQQTSLVNYIKEHPSASRREIGELLGGITSDGVKYHLNKLKEIGVLRRVGPDRGGHWEIIE